MKKLPDPPPSEAYSPGALPPPEWWESPEADLCRIRYDLAERAYAFKRNEALNVVSEAELKEIDKRAESIDAGMDVFLSTVSEDAEKLVFEVIRKYGVEIFDPSFMLTAREEMKMLKRYSPQDKLRDVLTLAIEIWQDQIKEGTDQEARAAKKRLQKLLTLLIPRRPKRKSRETKRPILQLEIREFYNRQLFKWRYVRQALLSSSVATPGSLYRLPRTPSTKIIKTVSEKFGIPVDDIRDFLGLDEDHLPDHKPPTLKEMARKLTAKQFKINLSTVSNLI